MLRCIFYPRWHWRFLPPHVKIHFVSSLASTQVEKHFVPLLASDGIGQHKLIYIFVSSLALERFGQHLFKFILSHRWHGKGLENTC